jgi:uncharacterized surface protein with fasciclin (FAS1) repeats
VPATVATSTTIAGAPVVTPAPSPNATLYDVVAGNAELSRLLDLVEIAEIAGELDAEQPRTLLAPSNAAIDAFAATPQGAAILADPEQLRRLLLDHLVTESLDTAAMFSRQTLTTVGGSSLPVDPTARTVDGASVLVADIGSANGLLHVVSTVISGGSF